MFLPLVFILVSETNAPEPATVLNNGYTQFGILFWLSSIVLLSVVYYRSQNNAVSQYQDIINGIESDMPPDYVDRYLQDHINKFARELQISVKLILASLITALFSLILIASGTVFSIVDISPSRYIIYVVSTLVLLIILLLMAIGVYLGGRNRYVLLASIDEIFGTELEPPNWQKLPQEHRTTLAAIGHLFQGSTFTREEFEELVEIEDVPRIFLDRRDVSCERQILEDLVDREILEKEDRGENIMLVDLESNESQDTLINMDDEDKISEKMEQFLQRENINDTNTDDLPLSQPSGLVNRLNNIAGRTVFEIVANTTEYRIKSMNGIQTLHDYIFYSDDIDRNETNFGWIP